KPPQPWPGAARSRRTATRERGQRPEAYVGVGRGLVGPLATKYGEANCPSARSDCAVEEIRIPCWAPNLQGGLNGRRESPRRDRLLRRLRVPPRGRQCGGRAFLDQLPGNRDHADAIG